MDSFNLKLERISSAKEAIKTSLTNKGMSPSDNIEDYAQIIDSIESGSGDVKLFKTIQEMQSDPTAKEGDLAVVYRSEVQNATVDSQFQVATFPNTVVLDMAITDYVDVRYRAVDSSKMFDCMGNLDSSNFRMDCYTESGSIRIEYTSSDGITYTRTDTTGNPVNFGTEIYYEYAEMWNDAIGKFIQVNGSTFEGLYEYTSNTDNEVSTLGQRLSNMYPTYTKDVLYHKTSEINQLSLYYDTMDDFLCRLYIKFDVNPENYLGNEIFHQIEAYASPDTESSFGNVYNGAMTLIIEDDIPYIGIVSNTLKDFTIYHYEDNVMNTEIIHSSELSTFIRNDSTNYYYKIKQINLSEWVCNYVSSYFNIATSGTAQPYFLTITNGSFGSYHPSGDLSCTPLHLTTTRYYYAPTQLSAIADYVYEKEFYGKNGIETGTLQNKENLTKDGVKRRVDIWSNYSSGIVCPSDTSFMFNQCTNLTEIPLLDMSSVTDMRAMFNSCTKLSDESLNNILAMCKNATSYTATKTLKHLGLTSTQANKCKTLSNYSAFTAAGWTTGY